MTGENPQRKAARAQTRGDFKSLALRAATRARASAPISVLLAEMDTSQRLWDIISHNGSADNHVTPRRVPHCEIWNEAGSRTPRDMGQKAYLGNGSRMPRVEEYEAAQASQRATYWLCWVSTRGQKGLWSVPVSATMPGPK